MPRVRQTILVRVIEEDDGTITVDAKTTEYGPGKKRVSTRQTITGHYPGQKSRAVAYLVEGQTFRAQQSPPTQP